MLTEYKNAIIFLLNSERFFAKKKKPCLAIKHLIISILIVEKRKLNE